MRCDTAWITWERQPRNISMARSVESDYFEIIEKRNFFLRYLFSIKKTHTILKNRYDLVFVQNPSIVLSFLAVIFKNIYDYKLVIDAHNAGVYPKEGSNKLLMCINNFILRHCDVVIVTNSIIKKHLDSISVKSVVISDPLPEYDNKWKETKRIDNKVFVICSWSDDEPISLYFDVAKELPGYQFYFSGNYKKMKIEKEKLTDNIILLGFVTEEEYLYHLFSCKVTVDLTERSDCLVCGAYESISAETPFILTDSKVNRETFKEIGIYSKLNSKSLLDSILNIETSDEESLKRFKEIYMVDLSEKISRLLNYL